MSNRQERNAARYGILGKYAYAWITLAFFVISAALHWYFGWKAYVEEAQQHDAAAQFSGFAVEAARDTFENWQSEFLQLLWQVVGLAYFLYLGSPSSKENDDRLEAKVDELLRRSGPDGEATVRDVDEKFLRHDGHAKPHGHER